LHVDTRAGDREAVHIIEPQKNESCARPKIGKWISCVAVDKADDWVVCFEAFYFEVAA